MASPLDGLFTLRNAKSKRISSYDVTGGNGDSIEIKSGETANLCNISGAGIIKHIWFTVACDDPMYRKNLLLRMYWDGEENESVLCPLGEFFGQGFGESYNFTSLPLAAAPKDGKALNCYFPMPFRAGAKITIENQSDLEVSSFYYYIDYDEVERLDENSGYFHALYSRELTKPCKERENEWSTLCETENNQSNKENYVIADIKGKGHFVGVNYYVDNPSPMWYGEGDDMWRIDGEAWPYSLNGTGTEDFFNTSWCPNEIYLHPYFGIARIDNKFGFLGRTHCYRFFIEDAVNFNESLHLSIEHGHDNCLTLDISTVAYWYQCEPHKPFDKPLTKEQRQNKPEISIGDIHRWRDAWRGAKGYQTLWGNEE